MDGAKEKKWGGSTTDITDTIVTMEIMETTATMEAMEIMGINHEADNARLQWLTYNKYKIICLIWRK
jgi:hypothetical protein